MLTNVTYRRFKQSDFHNDSFIIEILLFLVQNFNPVYLDIKLDVAKEREMVKFLKFKIEEKFELIHYVYLLLFSKIYNRTNNFGIKRKNDFDFNFQLCKKKKLQKVQLDFLGKNPNNYNGKPEKMEQAIDFTLNESPTMVYTVTQENGEIVVKNSEKRKMLEKKLEENTLKTKKKINK